MSDIEIITLTDSNDNSIIPPQLDDDDLDDSSLQIDLQDMPGDDFFKNQLNSNIEQVESLTELVQGLVSNQNDILANMVLMIEKINEVIEEVNGE